MHESKRQTSRLANKALAGEEVIMGKAKSGRLSGWLRIADEFDAVNKPA